VTADRFLLKVRRLDRGSTAILDLRGDARFMVETLDILVADPGFLGCDLNRERES
jgi:hypothetical protein